MKQLIVGLAAFAVLGWMAPPAQADFFAVGYDLPVSVTVDGEAGEDISGYKLTLATPIAVGLAFESYAATFAGDNSSTRIEFSFYELFWDLPVPLINVQIGGGVGTARPEITEPKGFDKVYDDAAMTQYYVSLGLPIAVLFDVHVGYHVFAGTAESDNALIEDLDVNGNMISVGAKIGF